MRWITLSLAALLLLVVTGVSAQDSSTLTFDGLDRNYHLHLPADSSSDQPIPLVIMLHPAFSSAATMELLTGMNAAADEFGFMVAYPDSSTGVWGEDGRPAVEQELFVETDDIGFIGALIDELVATQNADPEQVSVVGWGNGGLMAYRLGCEMPDRLQSIVVVGAFMWEYHANNCSEEVADTVNVLVVHGADDFNYTPDTHPYQSLFGDLSAGLIVYGLADTLGFWAERDGCSSDAVPFDETPYAAVYPDCENGAMVAYYDIQGGVQNWTRAGDFALNQLGVDVPQMIGQFITGSPDWSQPQAVEPEESARGYIAYVPESYNPEAAAPVVVVLHGRFGTGVGMASFSGFNQKADENGFIAVYPDGIDREWNYSRDVPYFNTPEHDDTLFLENLLDDLGKELNLDRSRVYAVGFSNGGFMAQRLACSAPDTFAAVASVASTAYAGIDLHCAEGVPVPILFIHGTDDTNVPWTGNSTALNSGETIFLTYPMSDTVGFWAAHNLCEEEPVSEDLPVLGNSPDTAVRVVTFAHCSNDTSLVVYAIVGGGHNFPGRPTDAPFELVGRVNMDFQPADVMWDFFTQFSLEE